MITVSWAMLTLEADEFRCRDCEGDGEPGATGLVPALLVLVCEMFGSTMVVETSFESALRGVSVCPADGGLVDQVWPRRFTLVGGIGDAGRDLDRDHVVSRGRHRVVVGHQTVTVCPTVAMLHSTGSGLPFNRAVGVPMIGWVSRRGRSIGDPRIGPEGGTGRQRRRDRVVDRLADRRLSSWCCPPR